MIYVAVAAILFGIDIILKRWVEKHWKCGKEKLICCKKLILRKYHNYGAFLDAGNKMTPVVTILSVVLTLWVLLLFCLSFGKKSNALYKTGLSILLGGAFSNTYDRLKRKYVVDYISFPVKRKSLRAIVFNIADFGIMLGAMLMVLTSPER